MFCDDGSRAYAGGVSVLGGAGLRGEIVLGLYEGSREEAARAVALRAIRFPGLTARANLCRPCGLDSWLPVADSLTRSVSKCAIEERSFVAKGAPLDDGQKRLGGWDCTGAATGAAQHAP